LSNEAPLLLLTAYVVALEMDWTEDDTMKTTINDISNITFIERRHAC